MFALSHQPPCALRVFSDSLQERLLSYLALPSYLNTLSIGKFKPNPTKGSSRCSQPKPLSCLKVLRDRGLQDCFFTVSTSDTELLWKVITLVDACAFRTQSLSLWQTDCTLCMEAGLIQTRLYILFCLFYVTGVSAVEVIGQQGGTPQIAGTCDWMDSTRPTFELFGDSITQRGFEQGGWTARLANSYTRRVSWALQHWLTLAMACGALDPICVGTGRCN